MNCINTLWGHIIVGIVILTVVVYAARFYKGGEYFESVALVCFGFVIGRLSAFIARSIGGENFKI